MDDLEGACARVGAEDAGAFGTDPHEAVRVAEDGADFADGQVVVGAGVEVVREVSFVVEGHEAEAVARAEP